MPPTTRSQRKAEEQDAGESPRPATSVPKTSNCSSTSVPKKSGFGKAAGKKKAASQAGTKYQQEAAAALQVGEDVSMVSF